MPAPRNLDRLKPSILAYFAIFLAYLFAISTEVWIVYGFLTIYVLGGLAGPALRDIISSQVKNEEQSELKGGLTSMVNLTSTVGPTLMGYTSFYFTSSINFYFQMSVFCNFQCWPKSNQLLILLMRL